MPINSSAAFPKEKLDRCGYLLQKEAAAKAEPWRAELKVLKDEIQAHYSSSPADVPVRATGQLYYIDLTKRELERTVTDKQRAFDALKKGLGIKALVESLSYTFKLLDLNVPADKQATFVTQERTGSRDMKAVLIAPLEVKASKAA